MPVKVWRLVQLPSNIVLVISSAIGPLRRLYRLPRFAHSRATIKSQRKSHCSSSQDLARYALEVLFSSMILIHRTGLMALSMYDFRAVRTLVFSLRYPYQATQVCIRRRLVHHSI